MADVKNKRYRVDDLTLSELQMLRIVIAQAQRGRRGNFLTSNNNRFTDRLAAKVSAASRVR